MRTRTFRDAPGLGQRDHVRCRKLNDLQTNRNKVKTRTSTDERNCLGSEELPFLEVRRVRWRSTLHYGSYITVDPGMSVHVAKRTEDRGVVYGCGGVVGFSGPNRLFG